MAKTELFIPLQLLLIYNETLKLQKDKLFLELKLNKRNKQ
jgi:hypothetical protein